MLIWQASDISQPSKENALLRDSRTASEMTPSVGDLEQSSSAPTRAPNVPTRARKAKLSIPVHASSNPPPDRDRGDQSRGDTSALEQLATEFPNLDPGVVADVWGSTEGNLDCVRGQLREMTVRKFNYAAPMFI